MNTPPTSVPWTPVRRANRDLAWLEDALSTPVGSPLPAQIAASRSRRALAEYYGTADRLGVLGSWRGAREAPWQADATAAGEGGVRSGVPHLHVDSDMSSSSDDDDERGGVAFVPGSTNPEDFFKEVRVVTAHERKRGNAALLGELIRRMDEPDDAEDLLRWVDSNQIPVNGVNIQLERDAEAEAAGAAAAGGPDYVAPVNATVNGLKTAFTNQFPMTGMQDDAEDNLDKCKQKSDINSHIRTYNRWLVRSGKIPDGSDASLQAVTSRSDKMKFVKVCSKNVHQMMTDEFEEVESMRTHLLRRLHQLNNLLLVYRTKP